MNDTQHAIERWGWASIGMNVILSLLNLGISVASGSLTVAAEMIHNVVDLVASVTVLAGLRISQRRSKAFPYGLYKVENVVSVGVSGLIFFSAYEIAHQAILGAPRSAVVRPWMMVGAILSAVIPLVFSRYQLRAGRKANSPSLIASAQEYRTHVLSSGIVFAALLGQYTGLRIDRWASLVVVIFILKTGWDLLRNAMRVLLDASLDSPTLEQIRHVIQSDPATARVKTLMGRNSGRYRFLEAEVELRLGDLGKAHAVSERIEQAIREKVPHVERVLIHYEPAVRSHLRYAFPLSSVDGVLSEHFGEAPYFAFVTVRSADGVVEKQELMPNPFQGEAQAKGIRVAEWVVSQKVDRIFVKASLRGKGPEYVFANGGVEVSGSEGSSIEGVLRDVAKEPHR